MWYIQNVNVLYQPGPIMLEQGDIWGGESGDFLNGITNRYLTTCELPIYTQSSIALLKTDNFIQWPSRILGRGSPFATPAKKQLTYVWVWPNHITWCSPTSSAMVYYSSREYCGLIFEVTSELWGWFMTRVPRCLLISLGSVHLSSAVFISTLVAKLGCEPFCRIRLVYRCHVISCSISIPAPPLWLATASIQRLCIIYYRAIHHI